MAHVLSAGRSPQSDHGLDESAGYAFAVIDYGQAHNLVWGTAINETGGIRCAPNPRARVRANWTMGRKMSSDVIAREGGDCSGAAEPIRAESMKPN